jgi:hypothetical protein
MDESGELHIIIMQLLADNIVQKVFKLDPFGTSGDYLLYTNLAYVDGSATSTELAVVVKGGK